MVAAIARYIMISKLLLHEVNSVKESAAAAFSCLIFKKKLIAHDQAGTELWSCWPTKPVTLQ